MPEGFRDAVIEALARVGPGQVVSYGDLAAEAGYPGAARGVGAVLAGAGDDGLTWWRVVYGDGRLAPGKEAEQGRRLRTEGVAVADGRLVGGRPGGAVRPRAGARGRTPHGARTSGD